MPRLERNVYTQTEYKKTPGSNKFFDNRASSQLLLGNHFLHRLHIFVEMSSASAFVWVERNDLLLVVKR